MKRNSTLNGLILLLAILTGLSSCTDNCEKTRVYRTTVAFQIGREQLKAGIQNAAPQEIENPGKIYAIGNFLLINEVKKGLHIIDNTNPSSPQNVAFFKIPGVIDMAVKGNILYTDNYTDLVAFDISDVKNIKEVGRKNNMFVNGMVDGISWYYDPYSKIITDYAWKTVTEKVKTGCGEGSTVWPGGGVYYDTGFFNGSNGTNGSAAGTNGQGGSMARFTIYQEYLYAATQSDLLVFDIKNQQKPDSISKVNLGWGIETIFPYQDKLFIGSNTGMHIFDNSNPAKPVRTSIFQHVRACDPVVVEGNKAYVTMRTGICGVAPNRMDVVDVSNLSSPQLIKSYEMENPHGLAINNANLMVCEGQFGLKSFNAANASDITLNQHIKNIDAFDVIPVSNTLLIMIGKDGLYQYDYSDPKNLKLLSHIKVKSI